MARKQEPFHDISLSGEQGELFLCRDISFVFWTPNTKTIHLDLQTRTYIYTTHWFLCLYNFEAHLDATGETTPAVLDATGEDTPAALDYATGEVIPAA